MHCAATASVLHRITTRLPQGTFVHCKIANSYIAYSVELLEGHFIMADTDATQPLDTTILSVAGRAAVPRVGLPATGAVLVHATPLGGPTRKRMPPLLGAILAPDSQQEVADVETPRQQQHGPHSANWAQPATSHADTVGGTPRQTNRGATEEEEAEELLLLPRTTSSKAKSAVSVHDSARPMGPSKSQAIRLHSAAVNAVLAGADSQPSSLTLAVITAAAPRTESQVTQDDGHGDAQVYASPTLMGDSSSNSSKGDGSVSHVAATKTAGSDVCALDGAMVHVTPSVAEISRPAPTAASAMPQPVCSIEPTLRVFEATLVVHDEKLVVPALPEHRVDDDAAYLDDLPGALPLPISLLSGGSQKGVALESPQQPRVSESHDSVNLRSDRHSRGQSDTAAAGNRQSVDAASSRTNTAIVRLPSQQQGLSQSSPPAGPRASVAVVRPPPIVQPEGPVDESGFKTPDKILRRSSQDDAPLVPVSTARKTERPPPVSEHVTPSRRKMASPNSAAVAVGDAVEVRWGGGWYPALIFAVASDGLTVVVKWPDGSTETKARNVVRAARSAAVTTPAAGTVSGAKRGRDSSALAKAAATPVQPSAEIQQRHSAAGLNTTTAKSITFGTQLVEALELECSPPSIHSVLAARPTTVLQDADRPTWTKTVAASASAVVPNLAGMMFVPIASNASGYDTLTTWLQGKGARVLQTVRELVKVADSDSSQLAIVVADEMMINCGTVSTDSYVPPTAEAMSNAILACPAGAVACAAVGMGLAAVVFRQLAALTDAKELDKVRIACWLRPSLLPMPMSANRGAVLPVGLRPLAGVVIAVATPPRTVSVALTLSTTLFSEVMTACGAMVVDAGDAAAVRAHSPSGVFCDP